MVILLERKIDFIDKRKDYKIVLFPSTISSIKNSTYGFLFRSNIVERRDSRHKEKTNKSKR